MYERNKAVNNSELYKDRFKDKDKNWVLQNTTKLFSAIKGVDVVSLKHIWKSGDTLLRLSVEYYNTTDDWWVIGIINGKPTDAHYKIGDVVYIPENPKLIKDII